ncbi:MAG: Permease of the major facilitator superfamily, partial [Leuconostoc sp. DORA_2]
MKMRQFKYIIMLAFIGIGIGSFFSLLSITLNQAIFSLTQFALLMTMSAIMGILSI